MFYVCAGVFPQKTPKQNVVVCLNKTVLPMRAFRLLPFMLGWATDTPPHIDFRFRQSAGWSFPCCLRDCPKPERLGEAKNQPPAAAFSELSARVSSNERPSAQGVKMRTQVSSDLCLRLPRVTFSIGLYFMFASCVVSYNLRSAPPAARLTSAYLQRAQGHDGEEHAQNVKSHHHLRLIPPLLFEVMMYGRH